MNCFCASSVTVGTNVVGSVCCALHGVEVGGSVGAGVCALKLGAVGAGVGSLVGAEVGSYAALKLSALSALKLATQ